jgi:AcrR family transcriptional regulator
MASTCKEMWLKEGLAVLAEAGHRNLTISILCDRLNLTTGSFYHHFKNRQAYSEAVLQYWEKEQTQRFIEQSEAQPNIQSKKNKLVEMALHTSFDHEPAIRAWAQMAPLARKYQQRIDKQRQEYMRQIFLEEKVEPRLAREWALVVVCIFIGAQQIIPSLSTSEKKRVYSGSLNLAKAISEMTPAD